MGGHGLEGCGAGRPVRTLERGDQLVERLVPRCPKGACIGRRPAGGVVGHEHEAARTVAGAHIAWPHVASIRPTALGQAVAKP
jgi:hypothetical protein